MQAGKLRHLVTIQKPVRVQDQTTGAMVNTWEFFADDWASVEPLSARDMLAAQAVRSKVTGRVVIRHRDDLTDDMRIIHGGQIFRIEGFLADKKSGREYITIPVSSGGRDG